MIRCLTKRGDKAFTLVELMIAVAFSLLLMIGVFGFYNTASQTYSSGVTGQALQDGADIVLSKIIEGETESSTVYRLSTAVSYLVPNGNADELYYCQDSPCGGANDPTARWYYLNDAGTAVIYHHPTSGAGSIDETIYSAPTGSTLTLRFSPAAVSTPLNVVEIDAALTQNLSAGITNKRLAVSGAASTFVLLRNHS